jgi:hypothetical protein
LEKALNLCLKHFVPFNLGLDPKTRADFITHHQPEAALQLFANDANDVVITIPDATYINVGKSRDFQVLQQSFCVRKSGHLFKPMLLVTTKAISSTSLDHILETGRTMMPEFLTTPSRPTPIFKPFFAREAERHCFGRSRVSRF